VMIDRNTLLAMLCQGQVTHDIRTAQALLRNRETLSDDRPSRQPAKEALRVWKVRQWNVARKGIRVYGLDSLVVSLQEIDGDEPVLGLAYTGPYGTGQFFIRERDLLLLGFVVTLDSSEP
jgi:hypothetical protein